MAKQTTVHAEVDKQTKAAIQRKAKDAKVSTSVIVRWALQNYLEGNRKANADLTPSANREVNT